MKKDTEDEKIQITVKIKKSMNEELEKMSKKTGINKTQLVINLIDTGLDDIRIFEKIGAYDLMMIGARIAKGMKEKFYFGKASIEDGELKIKMNQ